MPDDHPRQICLNQVSEKRLARSCCRSKSIQLGSSIPAEATYRRQFIYFSVPPWQQDLGQTNIFSELPGITGKDDDPEKILRSAIDRINSFGTRINIYTDGSVLGGWCRGGAGAVVTTGTEKVPTSRVHMMKKFTPLNTRWNGLKPMELIQSPSLQTSSHSAWLF